MVESVVGSTHGMNVRRHHFLAAVLPPAAIMILIDSLDVQFHRYQTHWRQAFAVCGVLHGEGGVDVAVGTIHVLEAGLWCLSLAESRNRSIWEVQSCTLW